jgi:hypothetical protein
VTITRSSGTDARVRAGRKSPLAAGTMSGMVSPAALDLTTAEILAAGVSQPREAVPAPQLRRMQISEFTVRLRYRTYKHHRAFQAGTIAA